MTEQSLYERIGGVNTISMVVDRFSDEVIKNPKLNVNPALPEGMEPIGQAARPEIHANTLDLPGGWRPLSVHRQGHARGA